MKVIKSVVLRLLYLTPIGYSLSLLNLMSANDQFGVRLVFPKEKGKHLTVSMVSNPTKYMRTSWFINGSILLIEGFIAFTYFANIDWVKQNMDNPLVAYIVFSYMIGITQIVVALFPQVNWNKRI